MNLESKVYGTQIIKDINGKDRMLFIYYNLK